MAEQQPILAHAAQATPVEYRELKDFPGYRVGSDGTVWTRRTPGPRLSREWKQLVGSWCGSGKRRPKGYYRLALLRHVSGKLVAITFHRLVLVTFVGEPKPGQIACHYNGDPLDNRVENLRWDTHAANTEDSRRLGTIARGETGGTAKLKAAQVPEIRQRYEEGDCVRVMAKEYGVCENSIYNVVRRITWNHI
jgi:hypothetical protein